MSAPSDISFKSLDELMEKVKQHIDASKSLIAQSKRIVEQSKEINERHQKDSMLQKINKQ